MLIGASWILPPHVSFYVLQRRLQEIWIFMLGLASIPFWLASLEMPLLALLLIPIVGLGFGLLIQAAFRSRNLVAVLLLVSFVPFNIFVSNYLMALGLGGGFLRNIDPIEQCQQIHSNGEGIRIVRYDQPFVDGGNTQYFFSSTDNGGVTWTQIGSASYSTGISSCSEERFYGNTDFNYNSCQPEENALPPWICFDARRGS